MVLQECGEEVEGLNVTTTYNEADKDLTLRRVISFKNP